MSYDGLQNEYCFFYVNCLGFISLKSGLKDFISWNRLQKRKESDILNDKITDGLAVVIGSSPVLVQ